jgi:hypothetical protein
LYESAIIDTCKCFGDVDTNCAIVGGLVGIINPPPIKWVSYCQPMEGVLGAQLPEPTPSFNTKQKFDKNAIKAAMAETQIVPGNTKEVDEVIEIEYSNPHLKKPVDFMTFVKNNKIKTV